MKTAVENQTIKMRAVSAIYSRLRNEYRRIGSDKNRDKMIAAEKDVTRAVRKLNGLEVDLKILKNAYPDREEARLLHLTSHLLADTLGDFKHGSSSLSNDLEVKNRLCPVFFSLLRSCFFKPINPL